MKTITVFIFCLITADISAQTQGVPTYYLNSNQIDMDNVYINPASIDSMRVERKTKNGEVYINAKRPLTFMSLEMILKKYSDIDESVNPVVYVINDKLIENKSKVKVDDSFFIQLEIKRFDRLTYIDEEHRHLILVEIQLLNEKPKPKILIRGNDALQVKK